MMAGSSADLHHRLADRLLDLAEQVARIDRAHLDQAARRVLVAELRRLAEQLEVPRHG